MTIQYDENGIIIQNLSEILEERETNDRTFLGDDFVISGESVVANIESADADREFAIQELLLYIAMQLDPDQAEGMWLDYICALNNITRIQATKTLIPITVIGTPGTSKDSGSITIVDESNDEYLTNQEAFILDENGVANVQFQATSFGPLIFLSTSNYSIKTPSIGITEVVYNIDGSQIVGRNTESDPELRERRKEAVAITATSILSSIKANVQQVNGVIQAQSYENDSLLTVDGIPAKSFEIVVRGGENADIAQAIYVKKPAGIKAYGTTTVDVTDEDGNVCNIGFTRPTEVPIDMKITIQASGAQTQTQLDEIKEALISKFSSTYNIGDDVYVYNLYCVLNSYPDIQNVTLFQVKKSEDDEWDSSVAIAKRELATLSAEDITITQTI